MTEAEARDSGDVETLREPFTEVDRAIAEGVTESFCKIHHRKGRIVGATVVGSGAGELITELTLAIQHKIKLSGLNKVIYPYPTRSEVIKHLADEYAQKQLERVKPILRWWLRVHDIKVGFQAAFSLK